MKGEVMETKKRLALIERTEKDWLDSMPGDCRALVVELLAADRTRLKSISTFKPVPGGWEVSSDAGETIVISDDCRGYLAAWTAFNYGSAHLSNFTFGDEACPDDVVRRSIKNDCYDNLVRARCGIVATEFMNLKVSEAKNTIKYVGDRQFITE